MTNTSLWGYLTCSPSFGEIVIVCAGELARAVYTSFRGIFLPPDEDSPPMIIFITPDISLRVFFKSSWGSFRVSELLVHFGMFDEFFQWTCFDQSFNFNLEIMTFGSIMTMVLVVSAISIFISYSNIDEREK